MEREAGQTLEAEKLNYWNFSLLWIILQLVLFFFKCPGFPNRSRFAVSLPPRSLSDH